MDYMKRFYTIFPLFLIILLDVLGICLVFPIFTPLFFDPANGLLNDIPLNQQSYYYGMALAVYPIFMFLGAPLFGDLSDKYGRKKILLFCLLGTTVGYQVSVLGIGSDNLWTLLAGRAICGFCAGSQPIAQAAIADVSTPTNKAINLSFVTMAAALGAIIGPMIGGITSDSQIHARFSFATPFTVGALFSLANAFLLIFFFHETIQPNKSLKIKLHKGLHLFIDAFRNKTVSILSFALLFFQFCWGFYAQTIVWIMQRNYHYTNLYLGMFLAFSGVGFVLASLVLVPLSLKIFKNEIYICVYSTMVLFILLFLIGFIENENALWYLGFCLSAANVLAYTLILTLFSNAINERAQGWIMGITGSISAVSFGVTALLLGPLSHWGLNTPIYAAAILGVISFCILVYYARVKKLNAPLTSVSNSKASV